MDTLDSFPEEISLTAVKFPDVSRPVVALCSGRNMTWLLDQSLKASVQLHEH